LVVVHVLGPLPRFAFVKPSLPTLQLAQSFASTTAAKPIATGEPQISTGTGCIPISAASVLTLALGIAANVIVFGVLQAMILRSVDVPHGDRVMTLDLSTSAFPFSAYPEVRDVRDDNTVFSAVAAEGMQNFGMEANGVTRPVWGYEVSGQYFEAVAIKPFLGRLLQRADDDHPDASQAAVLSWPAWGSYFGGDSNTLGKTIRLNKHPYTIVGVTPGRLLRNGKTSAACLFRSHSE
jgi:MacB-like periplasmic core domain